MIFLCTANDETVENLRLAVYAEVYRAYTP